MALCMYCQGHGTGMGRGTGLVPCPAGCKPPDRRERSRKAEVLAVLRDAGPWGRTCLGVAWRTGMTRRPTEELLQSLYLAGLVWRRRPTPDAEFIYTIA